MIDPDSLVECYDTIAANAPFQELEDFFSSHGFSPDDWYVWPDGVEVYGRGKARTWKPDETIVWDTLRSTFQNVFQHARVDEDDLVVLEKTEHRRKHYVRQGDLEIWVDCPDEKVYVSNLGRVRSTSKAGMILKPHKGGKVSGPWVKAYGKTIYVNDLIRKYVASIPGVV